jgi:RNA 2',3'-cyclic 3'-phosphodiesterase
MVAIRTFVAIRLEERVHARLERLMSELRGAMPARAIRWVAAENIHLTLEFLGDVESTRMELVTKALRVAAAEAAPCEIQVAGMGCFPNMRAPRVIWAGVQESTGALLALRGVVRRELRKLELVRDEREFSAHLTLGRVRQEAPPSAVREIGQVVEKAKTGNLGKQDVSSIHLFRSDLRPDGPIYAVLAEFPLGTPRE